jgi:hypothetical protein
MRYLLLTLVMFLTACNPSGLVSGLTIAGEIDTAVVHTIASGYCKLPEAVRLINRERINRDIAPNSIELHCG